MPRLRPRARFALALFALGAAVPAAAQPTAADEDARVVVSRREVRVVFPPEPAGPWRWTARDLARNEATFSWTMELDSAVGGPGSMSLTFESRERADGVIHTLAELVDTAWTSVCGGGMVNPCTFHLPTARVEDGRVVLVLRDSAEIARLFGLRPSHVRVRREHLARAHLAHDSVRVEYVEPAIPVPDAALRAHAARATREYEASVNTYARRISAWMDNDDLPTLWMWVGDTITVFANETHCHYDYCSMPGPMEKRGAWTVEDTSVARLLPVSTPGHPFRRIVAVEQGSTRVTVTGLGSPADTLPGGDSLPGKVTREILVRQRPARVELSASDTVVAAGETVTIHAAAFDGHGRVVEGAPVRMEAPMGIQTRVHTGPEPLLFAASAPGRYEVRASLASATATLVITVQSLPPAPGSGVAVPADDADGPRPPRSH